MSVFDGFKLAEYRARFDQNQLGIGLAKIHEFINGEYFGKYFNSNLCIKV